MANNYSGAPLFIGNSVLHRRKLAEVINRILGGAVNVTGSVTLTHDATSTTLVDSRINAFSFVTLMPLTANAVTALASVYYSGQTAGQVLINHASSANTDQSFRYLVIG